MGTRAGAKRARKLIKGWLLTAIVPLAAIWLYVVSQSMAQVSSLMSLARDIAEPARQASPARTAATDAPAAVEPAPALSTGRQTTPDASPAEPSPAASPARRDEAAPAPTPYIEPRLPDPYADVPPEDERLNGITDPRIRELVLPALAD